MIWFYLASVIFALLSHVGFIVSYSILVRGWRKTSIGRMMQWSSSSLIFSLLIVLYNNLLTLTSLNTPRLPIWVFSIALFTVGVGGLWQSFELIRAQRRVSDSERSDKITEKKQETVS